MKRSIAISGRWIVLALLVIAACLKPLSAAAADVSWISSTSGDWQTPTNWSTGMVPGPGDDVTIDQPGDLQVTISSPASVNSLNSQEAILLSSLAAHATLTLAADSTISGGLTLMGGASPGINGPGHLTVDGTLVWQSGFMVGPGTTTLAATSTTVLNGKSAPALFDSRILENAGTVFYYPEGSHGFQLVGGTFQNLPSGSFNFFSDPTPTTLGNGGLFDNAGTFNKFGSGDLIAKVPLNNSGTINLFTGKLNFTAESVNSGTINMSSTAGLALSTNYTNSGTINLHESANPSGPSAFSTDVLNNSASGHLNLLSGYSILAGTINHSGEINVAQGASLAFSGTLNAAAGSKITGAGSIAFDSPVTDFAGSIQVTGAVNVLKPMTFESNQTIAANFNLASDLAGSGDIYVAGPMTWSAGTMSGSGKTTILPAVQATIAPGWSPDVPAPTFARTLDNAGTINLVQTDSEGVALNFSDGTINNLTGGVFNIFNVQTTSGFSGSGTMNNSGVLNVSAGAKPFNFASVALNNTGTVNVYSGGLTASLDNSGVINIYSGTLNAAGANSGTIVFNRGGIFSAAALTNTGVLRVSPGIVGGDDEGDENVAYNSGHEPITLNIINARGIGGEVNLLTGAYASLNGSAGPAQNATAKITGGGNITLTNYTQYPFVGSLESTGNVTIAGTVNIDTDQTIEGRLVLSAGSTLGGTGSLLVNGGMDWAGGTIGGSGKLTLGPQSVTQLGYPGGIGPVGQRVLSRPLENAGSFNATSLNSNNNINFNAPFTNLPSGIVTVSGPASWDSATYPLKAGFDNQGVFRLASTTTSSFTFSPNIPFMNSGTIEILQRNTLQFNNNSSSTYTHTNGRIVLKGGTFTLPNQPLILEGGSIEGNGVVNASVIVDGAIIAPGFIAPPINQPSGLRFTGLILLHDAETQIDLGGTIPGVNYDSILTLASYNLLGGKLVVKFANGFESSIASGQVFQILNSGSPLSGAFLNVANGERLMTADGFGSFMVHYGVNSSLNPRTVILTDFLRAVPGDFDFDGDVDGADFAVWQTHFPIASGATITEGDADRDGDVDGADFTVWQTNFPHAPAFISSLVPEPASATTLLAATAAFAIASWRKRTRRCNPAHCHNRKQSQGR
ncbi:MAG: hypothetical protein IT427_11080 [Pirellulales bacterium]|nr:hypothetical protein [Pirellulales bacterium]